MKEPEYDQETCVTAGELRDAGADIPSDIPDVAWVPRIAMRVSPGAAQRLPGGRFRIPLHVELFAPFRWIALTVEQKLED